MCKGPEVWYIPEGRCVWMVTVAGVCGPGPRRGQRLPRRSPGSPGEDGPGDKDPEEAAAEGEKEGPRQGCGCCPLSASRPGSQPTVTQVLPSHWPILSSPSPCPPGSLDCPLPRPRVASRTWCQLDVAARTGKRPSGTSCSQSVRFSAPAVPPLCCACGHGLATPPL